VHLRTEVAYVEDTLRDFRQRLKTKLAPPKSKPGKGVTVAAVVPPTHAVVYYANEYPSWQAAVLRRLQTLVVDNALPENNVIAQQMSAVAELRPVIKKVMPFVTCVRATYERVGASALDTRGQLDEQRLLTTCAEYLCYALEVRVACTNRHISVQLEDMQIVASTTAELMAASVCPGEPAIEFTTRPHVRLTLHNVQVHNSFIHCTYSGMTTVCYSHVRRTSQSMSV
jgi:hypothetical protein